LGRLQQIRHEAGLSASPTVFYNGSFENVRVKERGKEFAVLFADVTWLASILNVLVLITSVLLILLVLIQRGKGGGLAGAFGGAGGSSAFGSRAGDMFTRITIVLAFVWIVLIMVEVKAIQASKGTSGPTSVVPGE
jgi:preprotein translocase subunit SecG